MEKAGLAARDEKMLKKAVEDLCRETDELFEIIAVSKSKVATLRDRVCKLKMQAEQENEANSANRSEMQKSTLTLELLVVQMKLENAQSESTASAKRVAVAKSSYELLSLISVAEKAYTLSEEALCSKSQARLHSQVF